MPESGAPTVQAAVDSHVREQLFRDCIQGFLGNKTRVLTTHHLRYLPSADRVVVLDAGSVAAFGSPQVGFTDSKVQWG